MLIKLVSFKVYFLDSAIAFFINYYSNMVSYHTKKWITNKKKHFYILNMEITDNFINIQSIFIKLVYYYCEVLFSFYRTILIIINRNQLLMKLKNWIL